MESSGQLPPLQLGEPTIYSTTRISPLRLLTTLGAWDAPTAPSEPHNLRECYTVAHSYPGCGPPLGPQAPGEGPAGVSNGQKSGHRQADFGILTQHSLSCFRTLSKTKEEKTKVNVSPEAKKTPASAE